MKNSKYNLTVGVASIVLMAALKAVIAAPPIHNPNPLPDPISLPKISGSIILSNCQADKSAVRVRASSGQSVSPSTRQLLSDGRVRMDYSMVVSPGSAVTVTPSIAPGVCASGAFSPPTRAVTHLPAAGVSFLYNVAPSQVKHLSATEFATSVNNSLRTLGLKLNNYQTQSSFVKLGTAQFPFQIPRVVVDLDCGTFCPDLGDARMYINDVNLRDRMFNFTGSDFKLRLGFEDGGREIKGIHSVLGDNGVPDFNMKNVVLTLEALPKVNASHKMTLGFYSPKLDAQIDSTGGCHIAGIDLCNKIFGTDRKIQKGVEQASLVAMNGGLIQAALSYALTQYLQSKGVTGNILSVTLRNNDLLIAQ